MHPVNYQLCIVNWFHRLVAAPEKGRSHMTMKGMNPDGCPLLP
jgi:hypothetical protein